MDTLPIYPEDYSDAQLRPCLAMFAKSKTYLTLIATAFVAFNATPSFAVEYDNWDWNSGAREEESKPSSKNVKPENKLDYEPDQTASQLSEDDRPESAEADRPEPSQPRKSRQTEEPSMSVNVAEPAANQSRTSTKTLVAGEDWRTGDRQTAAQAAIEKNPGIEKDCDGKVLGGDDSDAKQAEVDAEGNVTAAGMAEIKAAGKAHRQGNPNESQYKSDKGGDVG